MTVRHKWALAELALAAAVFLIQAPLILNADLGWLLTVCEKMLSGEQLYVDVIELNPPLSVFLYMPAAYLSRALQVPAHLFVIAMLLPLIWASANFAVRILSPVISSDAARRRARLAFLFVLAVLPGATFGQREHFAVIALVPFVALPAVTGERNLRFPSTRSRVLAGISAGFAMSIKPHFALIAGLPMLWNAAKHRSLKAIFGIEFWCASLVVVAYLAVVFLAFPEYFGVYARWAATVYVPIREPVSHMLRAPLRVMLWFAVLLWLTRGSNAANWRGAAPWLLAALGGFLSYLIQGKGWAYTRLPAAEFAVLAVLLAPSVLNLQLPHPRMALAQAAFIAVGILLIGVWLVPEPNGFPYLRDPIRAIAPRHPKIIAMTGNVGIGEPLTHKLGAEWGSGLGSQLLTASAIEMLRRGRLDSKGAAIAHQIIQSEHARFRRDLIVGRPDVVLFDTFRRFDGSDWESSARSDKAVSTELDRNYCFTGVVGSIRIWARRTEECWVLSAKLNRARPPGR